MKVVFCCNRVSDHGGEGEKIHKVTHYMNKSVSKWDCSGKEKVDVDKKDPLSFPQQINLFLSVETICTLV